MRRLPLAKKREGSFRAKKKKKKKKTQAQEAEVRAGLSALATLSLDEAGRQGRLVFHANKSSWAKLQSSLGTRHVLWYASR